MADGNGSGPGAGGGRGAQAASNGAAVQMYIWRGDPSGGDFVEFDVAANEGEVILDVIHRIQAEQAGDLAVRWNCKAGKCGSCSAEINGRPRLMCMTRMSTFEPGESITVAPLRTFPVIRDLVTDVSYNYEMAKQVPSFKPKPREKDGTYRMQQVDVERGQEFRKCIECFLCQNVCHVVRDHEPNKRAFAGPRLFIRYAELDMHPLDTNDRRELVQDNMGLGFCNITKCCTEVCPEHIKITDNGIIPLKERVADRKYDPLYAMLRLFQRDDHRDDVPEREGAGTGWAGAPPSDGTVPIRVIPIEPVSSTRAAIDARPDARPDGAAPAAAASETAEPTTDGAGDGRATEARPVGRHRAPDR